MKELFKYESIANQIQGMIQKGILEAGDKLMSVRAISKENNISLTTAFKAYEELIYRGVVESRPKSGYYVKQTTKSLPEIKIKYQKKAASVQDVSSVINFVNSTLSRKDLIRLSITAPDERHLPKAKLNKSMREALLASPTSCLNYEQMEGNPELRHQICRHTFGSEAYQDQEEVIVTQGCIEALTISLMAVTQPGDTILIEKPAYYSVFHIIKNLSLQIIETEVHPTKGIDLEHIEDILKAHKIAAILLTPNFHNPTGALLSNDTKKKVVELVTQYEVPLIEDNVSGELYFEDARPAVCKQYDQEGWVLFCSSFSKYLAPGYRVGWCLPGRFKERFLEIKLMHTVSSATPTQAALAQFFNTGRYDLYIRNFRKKMQIQCMQYRDAISKYFPEGTSMSDPKGGFVIWVALPKGCMGTRLFYEALDKGIGIFPGPVFSASGGFENNIRITFGQIFNQEIEDSLRTLGDLVKVLSSNT